MLILGRRPGDTLIIDGGIKIVVLQCDRGGVRLGIEAIVNQIADENKRANVVSEAKEWATTIPLKRT